MSNLILSPDQVLSGPGDVPHPRKWSPPESQDGIPLEQRKEWLREETLPFLDLFDRHVANNPDKLALTWFEDNGKPSQTFTYAQLDAKSKSIAELMLGDWKINTGDRVVLVYPPGLEFLVAFIACLRSGVIAVPVYPPNPNDLTKDIPKMKKIVEDSNANVVLTSNSYMNVVRLSALRFIRWPGKTWHTTDNVKARSSVFNPPSSKPAISFLQYTSGSTSDPKGVMVGETNIAHNIMFVRRTLRLTTNSRFFSWLPQYHDLGLIVAYLSTLSAGATGFYMSPVSFIKHPSLWIVLMSEYKITHTAAPNFALDLCSRKFDSNRDAPNGLDLSLLESLLNAAEPVRAESISKWNATFEPYGWHPSSMCPCYGLAEHVVGVVGWGTKIVEVGSGSQKHIIHSSGHVSTFPSDGRVVIVNPDTCIPCSDGEEGEIWVRSQHVALGYWGKPELSKETFQAKMTKGGTSSDESDYLRSGDLGFILKDELFVTGRIKDLIIVNGRNFYPQDIERSVEEFCEYVRPGCSAAFGVPVDSSAESSQEKVVIVAEVKNSRLSNQELSEITETIRRTVVTGHGLLPSAIALIPPRSIPKTTSGKIRRKETCKKYVEGKLKVLNASVPLAEIQPAIESLNLQDIKVEDGLKIDDLNLKSSSSSSSHDPKSSGDTNKDLLKSIDLPTNDMSWEGKSMEEAILGIIGVLNSKFEGEEKLVDLGLTSVSAMEVIELVEKRTGRTLEPEELQVLRIADLRALDAGNMDLPSLKDAIFLKNEEVEAEEKKT